MNEVEPGMERETTSWVINLLDPLLSINIRTRKIATEVP